MKKLLVLCMAALMLVSVMAPCALAAGDEDAAPQTVEAEAPVDEATAEVPPASGEDAADAEAPADDAAAEEEAVENSGSNKIYSTRNLIIGGVSIVLMLGAFIILKVKLSKG